MSLEERVYKLEVTCEALTNQLVHVEDKVDKILKEQQKIIRYVVYSLIFIIAAIVGVDLIPL